MNSSQSKKRSFDSSVTLSDFLIDTVKLLSNELIEMIRIEARQFIVKQGDEIACREYLKPPVKRFKSVEICDTDSLWFKTTRAQDDYFKSLRKTIFVQFTNCIDLSLLNKLKLKKQLMPICDDLETPMELIEEKTISNPLNFSETECFSDSFSTAEDMNFNKYQKKLNPFEDLVPNYELSLCCECVQADNSSMRLCRFIGWRKLMYDEEKDELIELGLLELKDSEYEDNALWEMKTPLNTNQDESNSFKQRELKIFSFISDRFAELISNELNARNSVENRSTWKRTIQDTRELCDKCCTTIFNGHFCCKKCGFSVCLSCYYQRIEGVVAHDSFRTDKDKYNWQYCSRFEIVNLKFKRNFQMKHHKPDDLIYVQYIPPHILNSLYERYNEVKALYATRLFELSKIRSTNLLCSDNCEWYGSSDIGNSFMVLDTENTSATKLYELFDSEWSNKRPVIVKNLHRQLSQTLWKPQAFLEEFGDVSVHLINCRNHKVVANIKLKYFWNGFENEDARMTDNSGRPMILKLKDWPTSDDFKNFLPSRFNDLMSNIPISEYTSRESKLNLASSLPDYFSKPDLGPKCYIAYSSIGDLKYTDQEGTTNLHVDISDAFNIMVYVGDGDNKSSNSEDINTLKSNKLSQKKTNCFESLVKFERSQYERYLRGERPGALWHIFRHQDADDIRKFLRTYKTDMLGKKIKKNTDPIHDQVYYIDSKMQEDLKNKYNVVAFTILQFIGDAIFIPAGAPHQVRNLASCIKVAGDFVSPQGIEQCFIISDQFRELSDQHANHEDKLQVRNIVFHRMKECLSILAGY